MEFFELVEKRRSIRAFKDEVVSDDDILKILKFVQLAPSAGNLQPYELRVVVEDEIKRELVQAAYGQGFIAAAPVVIVFIEDAVKTEMRYGVRGRSLYVHQDAAIAVTYAHLAAANLGLGSCWVGAFDSPAVARILDLKPGLVPAAILPVGYPAENPPPTPRRNLKELVTEK